MPKLKHANSSIEDYKLYKIIFFDKISENNKLMYKNY